MALFISKDHPLGVSDSSSIGVVNVYAKGGVGTRTTHLTSPKVDF